MHDPWDVKSVRQSDQYVSCIKFNGVPLLPPVLSKECRKEMQYYKLLAKEVEKRISLLQPYVESDSESEDKTDAPEIPEYEQSYELPKEEVQAGFNININKITAISNKNLENTIVVSPIHQTDICNNIISRSESLDSPAETSSPKLVIDVSLSITETGKNVIESLNQSSKHSPPPADLPERDYNCVGRISQKEISHQERISEFEIHQRYIEKDDSSSTTLVDFGQDGPSSLTTKSFTGSLNDLLSDSIKEQLTPKLLRQRSYTLLKPSPQLLAHLEVQSLNTGVEMSSISMSESLSNLSTPNRKRRSWDLETAKVKWSSMALELKEKNFIGINKNSVKQQQGKRSPYASPPSRAKSVVSQTKRSNASPKNVPKTEPLTKSEPLPKRKAHSPVRNLCARTFVIEPNSPQANESNRNTSPTRGTTPISESEDPATRVRELYEKIQKQQLIQMATLVEKQKREQLLLQQVFEEQNNLLYKQLKTICPKSPIEVKAAWEGKHEGDRGPVSLSQLINYKSPEQSVLNSPMSSTLTDTNQYINHCDKVLKQSRDISGSLKKQHTKSHSVNGTKVQSPKTQPDGSRTRTHSPSQRNTITPRRLNYDSASSEREYEPILTDRTNDTMADLNVTFPSDNSDGECNIFKHNNFVGEVKTHGSSEHTTSGVHSKSTEDAIRDMEKSIKDSIYRSYSGRMNPPAKSQPTPEERAAATKIVAYVKGYLVRRLMKTDRVQATVQTIKDALLCALQLHQDREGIRGADVDLHRRLIQQITAACYCLHETFIASSPAERCAMVATDRARRRSLAARQSTDRRNSFKQTDIMSQSHSGVFPSRAKRPPSSPMTQSNYETFSGEKASPVSRRYMSSPRRRPWR